MVRLADAARAILNYRAHRGHRSYVHSFLIRNERPRSGLRPDRNSFIRIPDYDERRTYVRESSTDLARPRCGGVVWTPRAREPALAHPRAGRRAASALHGTPRVHLAWLVRGCATRTDVELRFDFGARPRGAAAGPSGCAVAGRAAERPA